MNLFTFDIETIPDVEAGRKIHNFKGLDDASVADAMFTLQRSKKGSSFLPLHLHKIVAISAVLRTRDNLQVWSLGDIEANEAEIVKRFFNGIERYTPTLISWNGSGFDLPVLHYRAMVHDIEAARYWENGDEDSTFRWNNYLSRYHARHTDLMDVIASYQTRANAPLDQIATMLGFPGKMGMSGAKVWDTYQAGNLAAIRDYCETDVLNTYLVYLKFEKMRGKLNAHAFEEECTILRDYLQREDKPHFHEFLDAWGTDTVAPA